ncbi:hypothetical protein BKA80DRAFT_280921 [Phyllosticta citrichinensis]
MRNIKGASCALCCNSLYSQSDFMASPPRRDTECTVGVPAVLPCDSGPLLAFSCVHAEVCGFPENIRGEAVRNDDEEPNKKSTSVFIITRRRDSSTNLATPPDSGVEGGKEGTASALRRRLKGRKKHGIPLTSATSPRSETLERKSVAGRETPSILLFCAGAGA